MEESDPFFMMSDPVPEEAESNPVAPAYPALPNLEVTAVDGQGMWRAWTRVFDKPESACLDLLDNCLDATLHNNNNNNGDDTSSFYGRVVMAPLEGTQTGITITNNSYHEIKGLEEALTVYKSSKNSDASRAEKDSLRKDAIGENGVGLKHGCATLSNCSFVLTRNQHMVEVGVIAKALQSPLGVYLPSFSLEVVQPRDLLDICHSLKTEANEQISAVVAQELGGGNPEKGMEILATQVQSMFQGTFEEDDHVFHLILCNLHHSKKVVIDIDADGPPLMASQIFLDEIKTMLPEYYINIPSQGFDFIIDGTKTQFTYWQKRLVELTEFRINVPKDKPIEEMLDLSNWCDTGYNLRIYCGFDAQRLKKEKEGSGTSCKLYIYSRQAGRLIEKQTDARNLLNLGASGSNFMQGLTVIIADIESELPLMPTKDGIAWSEQRDGEVHKSNLLAWAGGIVNLYWGYHFRQIQENDPNKIAKETMVRIIKSFVNTDDSNGEIVPNLVDGDFSSFEGVKWRKRMAKHTDRLIISKANARHGFLVQKGKHTYFEITIDCIKRSVSKSTEEKRIKQEAQNGGKKRPARKKATPLRNADYVSTSTTAFDEATIESEVGNKKRPTGKKARNADQVPSLPGVDYPSPRVARMPTVPDISVSLTEKKRKSRNNDTHYVELLSSDSESDEAVMGIITPVKGPARKKRVLTHGDDDDGDLDDIKQALLEKDIQLKEEQLKTLKAEREARDAKKNSKDGEKLIRQLLSQLDKFKKKKSSSESWQSDDSSNLQEQLRMVTEERDMYKRRKEELEVLTGGGRRKKQKQSGQGASRVEVSTDSSTDASNESLDRIETI